MFKWLGNKRLFILLVGIIIFIALMGFTVGSRAGLSLPEKFTKDMVGFVQQVFYKPTSYIAGFFEDIANLKSLQEENEILKTSVAQYKQEAVRYGNLAETNQRLQENLDFTEEQKNRHNYKLRTAQVISVNSDPNNRVLNIDIGENAGLKVGMAVTTLDGLAGTISHVSNFTSTVTLLTALDPSSSDANAIAATVVGKENDTFGMIEKYNPQTGYLEMTKISENSKIAKDDVVMSSGIIEGFPKYMIIGTVKEIKESEFGLAQVAYIEPAANFTDWKEVFVVIPPEVTP
ncbi:rod shape-determining protein MreC [Paenibacillus urinalis]|uniref:Cell shape-determining protein MreC n=1 Tax=Paenibacillus urinalis TaxID=521520 RepID=A0AAX3N658_9BACL|nr:MULTISPECIES: rod shape-determining protein MreC [Paenibacillus]WDH85205.1 rod shape-determining protein MreC [Paenibacillus urinalis]WDH99839.1 rod shape-determining protein MreC [Paenibacillus urinalis]WDI04958.1 rod shape-determining protein MreC [Paenibacillus urinalis]